MFKIVSTACAALMAFSMPFAAPAIAMPQATPAWHQVQDVMQVQRDRRDRRDWRRGGYRDRIERRGNRAYWRGHRGYREYRPGYRRHGDFWFPAAAFIAGAIISGAIANQPNVRSGAGDPHLQWCYARYRSYRSSDNTFQPYNGPRRPCISPYY